MPLSPQRLKRLVRHRERLERLQERQFGAALAVEARRRAALEESRFNREQLLRHGESGGPVDVAGSLAAAEYLRRVDGEITARGAALAHSREEVEDERAALLDRRRDRKAVETLLDRRLEEQRLEAARAELRSFDELATARWRPPGQC